MSVRTRRALAPIHVQLTGMQPGEEPLVQLMLTEVDAVRESPRVARARDRRSRRLLRWSLRRARRHGRAPVFTAGRRYVSVVPLPGDIDTGERGSETWNVTLHVPRADVVGAG